MWAKNFAIRSAEMDGVQEHRLMSALGIMV